MNELQENKTVQYLKDKNIISSQFNYEFLVLNDQNFIKIGNGPFSTLIEVIVLTKNDQPKLFTNVDKNNLEIFAFKHNCSNRGLLTLTFEDNFSDIIQGFYEEYLAVRRV